MSPGQLSILINPLSFIPLSLSLLMNTPPAV